MVTVRLLKRFVVSEVSLNCSFVNVQYFEYPKKIKRNKTDFQRNKTDFQERLISLMK